MALPAEEFRRSAAADRTGLWSRLWPILRIGAAFYLGILLLFLFLENRLIYYPTTAAANWLEPLSPSWQDVYFSTSDGIKIHAWWCPNERADEVVLFCHGNAGNLSGRRQSIPIWQQELRASVLIFDYPGYGRSEGRPDEAGCLAAGEAAYQWLVQKKKVSQDKIILFGNSLGGGVAVHLAAASPHRALILARSFTSMPAVGQALYPWLPVRLMMRTQYDNLAKLPSCTGPVIVVHGMRDRLVPFSHAEQLYQAAPAPKFRYWIEDGDHNGPLPHEFYRAAREFLDGKPPPKSIPE